MEERLLAILRLALKYNATDIHFYSNHNQVSIDMRIDGVAKRVKSEFSDNKLIRYLQYLANLDIGNLKEPQTGQLEMEVDDNLLSLRFAVINSLNYTDAVLRILNNKLELDVDHLSLLKKQNDYFKSLFELRSGLILFSGPTGSGKTTTLYTLLKSLTNKKIYTIEDPIEIHNDEFIQLEINAEANFDYAQAIRQILRHDPDIIMIGEIRDEKAAAMALRASNTGHIVLSTIHASSASSVISRMVELGVDETHLYEELLSISNQRMMIGEDNQKLIIYEVMDKEEINYYRKNKHNSNNFLSLDNQIKKGISDGTFKKLVK